VTAYDDRSGEPAEVRGHRHGTSVRAAARATSIDSTASDASSLDRDPFGAQPALVFGLVPGYQPPSRGDHSPPRDTNDLGQDATDGPGRAWMPGLIGDLAVRDDLARPEPSEHLDDVVFECHAAIFARVTSVPTPAPAVVSQFAL
jgi:hypothetical protein